MRLKMNLGNVANPDGGGTGEALDAQRKEYSPESQ